MPFVHGQAGSEKGEPGSRTSPHRLTGLCLESLLRYSVSVPPQRALPTLPSLPAEAALSFLKDTKGALRWSSRDLAEALNLQRREAEQVLAVLEAQGYAQPARAQAGAKDQWLTTPAGETIAGAKPPRFTRERVEEALAALEVRIQQKNKDPESPFRVTSAIAFGDFLLPDRARVQAADVGIALARQTSSRPRSSRPARRGLRAAQSGSRPGSSPPPAEPRSASEAQAERSFLRELRAKSALLTLRPCADWMGQRSHRALL